MSIRVLTGVLGTIGLTTLSGVSFAEAPASESARIDRPRSVLKIVPPELLAPDQPLIDGQPEAQAGEGTIVYMNRMGGTFTPGANDARNNRSSIIESTVSIQPWNVSDAVWGQVMTCMQNQFAPFDVLVTDQDPGNVPHYESVVAGRPTDIGMPENVGGVSPFTTNCSVIGNSVVYTFAEVLPMDPQLICEIAAQEFAHSIGLDHQYMCEDPMTYLTGCGDKSFQNVASSCGEYSARGCRVENQYDCGSNTQNSYQLLMQRLGPRQGDGLAPTLSILSPSDGQRVAPGFTISADATDGDGIQSVEVLIDGISIDTRTTGPYDFTAPSDLLLGTHVVEVIATDGGQQSTLSIAIELVESGDEDGSGGGNGDGSGGGNGGGQPSVTGGCNAAASGNALQWAWLLLFAFGARRRRRD